ncbi:MAG: hypothetical protein ACREH4_10410, partial [Vitreimonas sp.]
MRRTLVLLATLLAASLLSVQPSRAQFAECTDSYVSKFRVGRTEGGFTWYPGQLDCHEFWRFSFSTPAGPRWVRLIGDRDAGPQRVPPGGIEAIREGALRATAQMRNLRSYAVDNITMMIGPHAATTSGAIHGFVPAAFGPSERLNECHVTLLVAVSYSGADLYETIGHELFHCVEQATLSPGQFATVTGNGTWWGEGAAVTFGAISARERSHVDFSGDFETSVRGGQPLYDMGYAASIFFYWHYQEYGLDDLMPFLRQMADVDSDAAQVTAMSAALPTEAWRDFAQAYDDRRIRHPADRALISFGDRVEGETWSIEEATSRHERRLRRFVLETGWADYACGVWANEVNASSIEVRPEDGGDWGPWPARFDTEGTTGVRLRLATMTSMADVDLVLASDKREACRTCDVSRAIDSCVVGRWRQTSGGPLEYLRSRGVPITMIAQDPLVLTMRNDGTFSTNAIRTSAQVVQQMPRGNTLPATGSGTTSPVHGRWSAEGGVLQGCIDSGGEREGVTRWPNPPEADRVSRMIGMGPYTGTTPWGGSVAG